MSTTDPRYMRDPPAGEDRWTAGTVAASQRIVGAAAFAFATLVYAMRVFTRIRLTKMSLLTDDYLAGAALLSCWLFYGCTMGMIDYGGCARNLWQVTVHEYETLLKWTVPVNIFYMLSSDLAKMALLFLYLRLSPDRTFRLMVLTFVSLFGLYAAIYAIISIFNCKPVYASWDLVAAKTASCINKAKFYLAASIANICMDVVILMTPLRIVMPLQMPVRQKVSIFLLFATGGFVIIVAVYNSILTVRLFTSDNYTNGLSYELSWMYGELAGCVVCSSASSLKPFFMRYLPSLLSSRFGTSRNSRSAGTELSRAAKGTRIQLSRKQPDAYELESGDDSESGRKMGRDDDEAKLWSGDHSPQRPDTNGCTTLVSANRDQPGRAPVNAYQPDWEAGPVRMPSHPKSPTHGISVIQTTDVSYSDSRPVPSTRRGTE